MVLYFGPCWWFLGLIPLVVAGYESTRHVYLASAGWAIVLGLVWMERTRRILHTWSQRGGAPTVALRWDARSGTYSRLTDREDPALGSEVMALLEAKSSEDLDRAILAIVRRVP
jgi:hypothetical protein